MKQSVIYLIAFGLCLLADVTAKPVGKTVKGIKSSASIKKSALVTYVSTEGGSGVGYHNLRLKGRVESFVYDKGTRWSNMSKPHAYDTGAEWKIIYSKEKKLEEEGFYLWSVTFTGRVLK